MSWFSRSFSMNDRRTDRHEEEEEEEKEGDDRLNFAVIASATGTSVKEDFSNLTKTLTRQLWGVASFLAPPPVPAEKGSSTTSSSSVAPAKENIASAEESLVQRRSDDGEVRSSNDAAAEEVESPSKQRFSKGPVQADAISSAGQRPAGDALPDEGDPCSSASPVQSGVEGNAMSNADRGPNRPSLVGLRSDFAELRGTMASGFSRISSSVIRAVAGDDEDEEDEQEGRRASGPPRQSTTTNASTASEGSGSDQQSGSSGRRFDAFIKPLLVGMLSRERHSGGDEATNDNDNVDGLHVQEGEERDANARKASYGGGETRSREMESLPLAIASGIGGISKFASTLLQIVRDDEEEDNEEEMEDQVTAVGVTEAVVTFGRNIAMHPETWLDFPTRDDETDDDFELTSMQKAHAHALEIAAPRLAALQIELCPNYMTKERFWKIYFVLMHSRLSSDEAQILSTGQVVRARTSMLQDLQKRDPQSDELDTNQDPEPKGEMIELDRVEAHLEDSKEGTEEFGSKFSTSATDPAQTPNTALSSSFQETEQITEVDRSTTSNGTVVVEPEYEPGKGRFAILNLGDNETEVDAWLDEEPSTKQDVVGGGQSHLDMDEDVSFSDLEDDDSSQRTGRTNDTPVSLNSENPDNKVPGGVNTTPETRGASSLPEQGDEVPLRSSEKGEFNDWLTVDQDDVALAGSSSP